VYLLGWSAACWRESAAKNAGILTKGDQPPYWYAVFQVFRPYELRKRLVRKISDISYAEKNYIQKLQFFIRSTVTGDTEFLEIMQTIMSDLVSRN